MARIIGAIATSHTPTIGFAYDTNKGADPVWKPIFEAYEPIRAWLAEKRPDALLIIYNDHVTSFFFDHYSAFALGVGEHWAVADEGGGARDLHGHGQPDSARGGARQRHPTTPLPAWSWSIRWYCPKRKLTAVLPKAINL